MPAPIPIQHVTGPQTDLTGPNALTDYIVPFPNAVLSGNCVLVGISYASGVTSSVTDDKANTYAKLKSVTDAGNSQIGEVWAAFNVTNGPRTITASFSSATIAIWGVCTEVINIATASASDVNNGLASSGTTVTSGSMTPTVSGDFLYQVFFNDGAGVPMTGFTVGSHASITWKFLGTEKYAGTAVQCGQYNSTSAINPTFTVAPTSSWISICVALKSAAAGTSPSAGIHVDAIHHNDSHDETTSPVTLFWPTGGFGSTNLLVLAFITSAGRTITAISDGTNTWAQAGSGVANDSECQIWYAANATATSPLSLSITLSGTFPTGHGDTFMCFEVSGAASSPFDTTNSATGNNTSGNITANSITPSTANGLVISIIGVALNTVTGITTTGSRFIGVQSTGEAEPTWEDENNGWAMNYNPAAAAISNVYTVSAAVGLWASYSAAFKAATPPTSFLPLLGPRMDVLLRM